MSHPSLHPALSSPSIGSVLVVGGGRMGTALVAALCAAGVEVQGPAGRGATGEGAAIVLLAVPDAAIAAAASAIMPGPLVGHLSGAMSLEPLAPHDAFGLHPLMTVTGADASFEGVPVALSATGSRARDAAEALATALGMTGFRLDDSDRPAYHAAASIASNYLLTLEDFAERLAATADVSREALVPLVRASLENWATRGAADSLTGPIARGDEETVARQRAAVATRLPRHLALFDALTLATRELAASVPPPSPRPQIARTVAELREILRPRRAGTIGFVPTMGALHEGHLSLVRAAREESDTVVLSIFVNPTQFGEAADLAAYPRTEASDVSLATSAGVDVIFAPNAAEMYPSGFATTVAVHGDLVETLEGAVRGRDHFDGVATVVTKLLLAVLPDAAYFGAKDAQQVVVVRRIVADLNIPVRIVVGETSRDADGLARSSRNARLSDEERARALALPRALFAIRDAAASGEVDSAVLTDRASGMLAEGGVTPEYFAIVDPDTLEAAPVIDRPLLVVVAARVGDTRLIDNTMIAPGETVIGLGEK